MDARNKLFALVAAVIAALPAAALADGMIVPVRPDLRVAGHWAVKYHHVQMTVRDQVASVTIDQEFVNTGHGMIEVQYLFPVPPEAAIDAMTLVVNGKEFTAELLRADEARKIYEDIVRRKKDPALLEYVGYGLYRTRAFPLEPDKPAKIVVHYDYVCKKDNDLVEVWYPLNTEKFSAKRIEDVKVVCDIKADSAVAAVYSPTHDLTIDRRSDEHVIATYHEKDTLPTFDFQCFYKPTGHDIGATLLTYQPKQEKDGYFLLLVSPNPSLGRQPAVAKDVVVAFDHSGSMGGEKMRQAREALRYVLDNLNSEDRFNVIAYNDTVRPFFDELQPVTDENLAIARDTLDRIASGGGTNIAAALEAAAKADDGIRRRDGHNRPKYILFLTDGIPTVGETNEKKILDAVDKANQGDARVFAFGIGYDVNVRLLDLLAERHGGRSRYVKPNEPIEAKVSNLYAKIRHPVMTDLAVKIRDLKLRDRYPRDLGDLFEGDQIVLVGRYENPRGGETEAQLVVTGDYRGRERGFEYPVTVQPAGPSIRFAFVERLWAVRRVGYLMDQVQFHGESEEVTDEIVRLSTTYGIMTPYTSFLADETTRLNDRRDVRSRMREEAGRLAEDATGWTGQNAAKVRGQLRDATLAPAPRPAPTTASEPDGAGNGVALAGNTEVQAYEAGERERVGGVRQVGNQALYRRGRAWVAANASHVDLDAGNIDVEDVERFSEAYFRLVRANTVEENQILSTQQAGEELIIALRGQVYRIH